MCFIRILCCEVDQLTSGASFSQGSLRNLKVSDQENDRGGIPVGDSQVVQSQDGVKLSYRPYAYTRI